MQLFELVLLGWMMIKNEIYFFLGSHRHKAVLSGQIAHSNADAARWQLFVAIFTLRPTSVINTEVAYIQQWDRMNNRELFVSNAFN